jgi:hypothetical protein
VQLEDSAKFEPGGGMGSGSRLASRGLAGMTESLFEEWKFHEKEVL